MRFSSPGLLPAAKSPSPTRRAALAALIFYAAGVALFVLVFRLTRFEMVLVRERSIAAASALVFWIVPVIVAHIAERRGPGSLGLAVKRKQVGPYLMLAPLAIFGPGLLLGQFRGLPAELAAQVFWIGLPEEFFYRGYLQTRFCEWLGRRRGWLLAAALFGLGHVFSRLVQGNEAAQAAGTGFQAFLGGLLFGALYLRSGNIVPPAVFHIAGNLYFERLVGLLG